MRDAAIISELGLLVPNIELSTGCNPAHMPGSAPGTLAQSLAHRLLALLKITDLVPLAALEIRAPLKRASDGNEVMAYWTLYIDILVISLDGCAFDAAWAAVLSSLQTALLPNAWWDADVDEMRCDPRKENGRNLSLRGLPVALSYGVFQTKAPGGQAYANGKSWVLADPDDLEESCCDGFVTIVVDEGGKKIIRIEAGGAIGGVGIKGMHGLVRRAAERWTEWKSVLKIQESLQKIG